METGMMRRRVRGAAVVGLVATALLLLSVPVVAEVARLTSLPLGKGTATVTWTGKGGVNNTINGSARGLPIVASGTVPATPNLGPSAPSNLPLANVKGTLAGVSFTVHISLTLSGVNLNSKKSVTFGAVTGSFRGQAVKAVLLGVPSSSTVQFKGTIGADHVTGTIAKVIHHGNEAIAHATFDVSK
jgi:hypothetical protein